VLEIKFSIKDKVCAKVKNKFRVVRQRSERQDRMKSIEWSRKCRGSDGSKDEERGSNSEKQKKKEKKSKKKRNMNKDRIMNIIRNRNRNRNRRVYI